MYTSFSEVPYVVLRYHGCVAHYDAAFITTCGQHQEKYKRRKQAIAQATQPDPFVAM